MKRWLLLGVLGLAVVLAVGGASLAAGGGSKHGITQQVKLRLLEVTLDEAFVDVAPKGTELPSPGDTFFFHNELRNAAGTKKKGTFDGRCIFLIGGMAECRGHVALADGTIELGAGIDFSAGPTRFEAAVLGGTRRYENVVGEAKITQVGEGRSQFVIELIPSFRRP
jgi:hypothetical protein